MRKPNLFIVGAPKCGTTSLSAWLSHHPNIFMSNPKEPHYFNKDHYRAINASLEQYLQIFRSVPHDAIAIGEASTYYLLSEVATKEIMQFNPDSKFVVCVRDPAQIAYSLYLQKKAEGKEQARTFEEAWSYRVPRQRGEPVKIEKAEPKQLAYDLVASIGTQTKRLISEIGKSKVHLILLDEMAAAPRRVYVETLEFLGVPDDGRRNFPLLNPAGETKKGLAFWVLKYLVEIKRRTGTYRSLGMGRRIARNLREPVDKPPLSEYMEEQLHEVLQDERCKLHEILESYQSS